MKKIIRLTESDLVRIVNRVIKEQPDNFGGRYSPKAVEYRAELCQKYPTLCSLMTDAMLWTIPVIGPYLVAGKGTVEGVISIKQGHEAEGVIKILTSPLALLKVIRVMNLLGLKGNYLPMLETIHKSGLPLLISKGKEAFLIWGWNNFGKDFEDFLKLLTNKKSVIKILDNIKTELENKKKIKLKESNLVSFIRKIINEQPGKIIGQNLVRPVLNLVRGQGGKQISKKAKLGQDIGHLRQIIIRINREEAILIDRLGQGKINQTQYNSELAKLRSKSQKVRDALYKRYEQLNIEKNRMVVANTPQENIIKSRYEAIGGKDIRQGGINNRGVFDLGNGYVAKIAERGWQDPGIQNVYWKDKIKSPRVMKTVQVKSFIDSEGKEVVYQIQQKATGTPLKNISIDDIPEIHRTNFKKDLEELHKNKINIDSNKENFLYDPNKGIQFIDLGGQRNIPGDRWLEPWMRNLIESP